MRDEQTEVARRWVGLGLALACVGCGVEGGPDLDGGPEGTGGATDTAATGTGDPDTEGPTQDTAADPTAMRTVFLTNEVFTGDLGGLAGADAQCQRLADGAGLGGVYRAWLSDATASPSTRFVRGQAPYVLVDGTPIADDWADLVDGELEYGINVVQDGSFAFDPIEAWTNTDVAGDAIDPSLSCEGWRSAEAPPVGGFGDSTAFRDTWTRKDVTNCNTLLRLYCFQQ